jgi:ABC-type branched-subunit amino acid transport system permease subunit
MDILTLIVTLVVIGFVTWLLTTYVPMPPAYKQVLLGIVILLVVIWLLRILIGPLPRVVVP